MTAQGGRPHRVTIADIAVRAGVSTSAVSYALNDRPGISVATRARVLAIAAELGWHPNSAARALQAARADACGLVFARPARTLAFEPYFMELIAGVESELSARSIALTLQVVEDLHAEIEVYRRWWAERRVDGVLVVDLRDDDPRVDELVRLGLPAVVVGGPVAHGRIPSVWHDEASVVVEVVRYLAALGHTRIARVTGVDAFVHTRARTAAFERVMAELGLPSTLLATDFTPESGARATRRLLSDPAPPTAIVYESDVLAVAGLGVAHQMGFVVPADVSLVAWDDSFICQAVHPPLTAVSRDVVAYGARASTRLLAGDRGRCPRRRRVSARAARPPRQHGAAAAPRRGPRGAGAPRRDPAGVAAAGRGGAPIAWRSAQALRTWVPACRPAESALDTESFKLFTVRRRQRRCCLPGICQRTRPTPACRQLRDGPCAE